MLLRRVNSTLKSTAIINGISAIYCFKMASYSSTVTENKETKEKKESKRLAEFRKKLRETTPIEDLGEQPMMHPAQPKDDPLLSWSDNTNPNTGEVNGPRGPEPTRFGDWERKGRVSDF